LVTGPFLETRLNEPFKIADWVAHLVLDKEDSRKRANVIKHLISVADVSCSIANAVVEAYWALVLSDVEQLFEYDRHHVWSQHSSHS
jgi:hypothetical protein